jgi:hypothetical protein
LFIRYRNAENANNIFNVFSPTPSITFVRHFNSLFTRSIGFVVFKHHHKVLMNPLRCKQRGIPPALPEWLEQLKLLAMNLFIT